VLCTVEENVDSNAEAGFSRPNTDDSLTGNNVENRTVVQSTCLASPMLIQATQRALLTYKVIQPKCADK